MASTTKHRHRMRCREPDCRARFTLKKAPEKYIRTIKCRACGSTYVRSIEAERQRELEKQVRCFCPNYPFPHRAGSMKFCQHSIDAGVETDEQDVHDWEAVWRTDRSG